MSDMKQLSELDVARLATSAIFVTRDKSACEVAADMIESGLQKEPFYIFDFDAAYNQVQKFKEKMPRVRIFYAMKSNDDSMMLKLAIALGLGFDCASPGEINKIREHNVRPTSIIYAAPMKTPEQMRFARESGVKHTTFDSSCELNRLKQYWPDARYSATGLPAKPSCGHNTKSYACASLNSNDVFKFHKDFYSNSTKAEQDNYILKYCQTTKIKRKRPTKGTRNSRECATKYYVCKALSRKLVPVCFKSFLAILRLKKGRVQGVLKDTSEMVEWPKKRVEEIEKRFSFAARKEAIEKFIQTFKPMETHYCRGKDRQRIYLAPDLSIKKMFNMYLDQVLPGYSVTLAYFRKVFNTSFNIGFGSVRQDVCSTCLMLTENIKLEKNATKKQELMVAKRIHSLRARAFFNYLKEEKEGLVTISFDCQKNLPMPKVPDQATYYSRQMYLYNFSVVIGSSRNKLEKDNIFAYVWTEDMAAKSSNEICSALYHTLSILPLGNATSIRLMADGCAGQNKNTILIGMLMKWFSSAPRQVKRVEVIFPVTGHSYMPPDRVFALIEKKCRVHETIINPEEYKNIIEEHATIRNLASDVLVYDWRTAVRNTIKTPDKLHFRISTVKRIIIKRSKTSNNLLVRGELSYNSDTGVSKTILKRGKQLGSLEPEELPRGVSVSQPKLTDVKNLLQKHYGDDWASLDSLCYFKNLLRRNNNLPQVDDDCECDGRNIDELIDFV